VDIILAAIENQKRGREWREGYVPYMRRWIKGERWEDEVGMGETSTRDEYEELN